MLATTFVPPTNSTPPPLLSRDAIGSTRPREGAGRYHSGRTPGRLYHTFVEVAGVFDKFHFAVTPENWYGASVWRAEDWASWSPEQAFGGGSFRFSVLQSTAGRSAQEIASDLSPFWT